MSEKSQHVIDDLFEILIKTYTPQPVIMDHGKGSYVWDTDGKKYLDFAVGIAVVSLGHSNPAVLKAMNDQAQKLMMCQQSYATEPKLRAAKLLVENSCVDLIYFCNSGTEAIEAAMKTVRKWAHEAKGPHCTEIIAFRNSFHGRTYGAASITEKRHTQEFFNPYIPDCHFATFNDLESVKKLISEKTCAIFLEPVQGEGGLLPADPCFLMGLRKLCDEHNIALVFDEVQAGMGRLGHFNAYDAFTCCGGDSACVNGSLSGTSKARAIEPDIICWAKGMGSGFPVGAMGAKKKFGDAIIVGTHGTTYGGNPLACAVAATVMEEMLRPGFMQKIAKTSKVMFDGLHALQRASNKITAVKGKGLMIGLDTVFDIKDLLNGLQKNGLLATQAGKSTLRLTPPLTLLEDEAKEALEIIEKTLQELEE